MKVRFISAVVLFPLAVMAIVLGDWVYAALVFIATSIACAEYTSMLRRKSYKLALPLTLAMNFLWLADALWGKGLWIGPGIAGLLFFTSTWALYRREKYPEETDPSAQWALTLAGGLYIGIGGAYLLRLRAIPDGLWWTLTSLPIVWVGESMAYFIGSHWGAHKMAPHISPGKSWEGYLAQVISGGLTGTLLGGLWPLLAQPGCDLNSTRGLILGIVIASLTTMGDFFVSMIKREVAIKDSSRLIPGHGGAFDRIDSVLWVGIIAYWLIKHLLLHI